MPPRQIIQRGQWLYDGMVYMPATIVALDYDFWYELGKADNQLEAGEEPELNPEGRLYYVCFRSAPAEHPGWVDSPGFPDADAARAWAATKVPGAITWFAPEAI